MLSMFSYILLSICSSVWVLMTQVVEYFEIQCVFSSPKFLLNMQNLLCCYFTRWPKKSDTSSTTSEFVQSLLSVVWSFVIVFAICEFGERLTMQFVVFSETISQCRWYTYPIEMQRILPILIANTQQPGFIESYGNIECTRDSFKKVSNSHKCRFMVGSVTGTDFHFLFFFAKIKLSFFR